MSVPAPNAAGGQAAHVSVGVAVDANTRWRRTMEDAHMCELDFDHVPGQALFGVFDGHAGKYAAEWCREHLGAILQKELRANPGIDVREAWKNTYLRADDQLEIDADRAGTRSGCTSVTALLRTEQVPEGGAARRVLYTANVGDGRSVLWYVRRLTQPPGPCDPPHVRPQGLRCAGDGTDYRAGGVPLEPPRER